MTEFFNDGRVADWIFALMFAEGLALVGWHRLTGKGPAPADILPGLAAGMALILALRSALVGAAWQWIWLCLTLALIGHALDLARRWRARAGRGSGE